MNKGTQRAQRQAQQRAADAAAQCRPRSPKPVDMNEGKILSDSTNGELVDHASCRHSSIGTASFPAVNPHDCSIIAAAKTQCTCFRMLPPLAFQLELKQGGTCNRRRTFLRILPRMWHSRLTPSMQCASRRPLPSMRSTWAYSAAPGAKVATLRELRAAMH